MKITYFQQNVLHNMKIIPAQTDTNIINKDKSERQTHVTFTLEITYMSR